MRRRDVGESKVAESPLGRFDLLIAVQVDEEAYGDEPRFGVVDVVDGGIDHDPCDSEAAARPRIPKQD